MILGVIFSLLLRLVAEIIPKYEEAHKNRIHWNTTVPRWRRPRPLKQHTNTNADKHRHTHIQTHKAHARTQTHCNIKIVFP